jgi:hypothetical protein
MSFFRALIRVLLPSISLLVAACFSLSGLAQTQASTVPTAGATWTKQPPILDGTLNDPVWQTAPPLADFRQREPLETMPATERTEVRILYDARHIYFGIHCYDSKPKGIAAAQLRQDVSQDLDDNFAIMIDPTLGHRSGYVFQVNPLGTQRDGEIIEEEAPPATDSIVDSSWDALWISAARITNDGWTATIAIPFSTLNFRGGAEVSWGVNFRRFIRRKNEEDEWAGYRRVFGFWRVSQAGVLSGLQGIESGRLLVVKPYGLLGGQSLSGEPWSMLHTGGLDVKYGLANNLVALGTVNTDFSDADVDEQQFNLTPYPVLIPEKRRFFLEDSDVFDFLLWNQDLLFFTRQIGIDPVSGQEVPINAGGKIAGHLAGFDLGLLDVGTRAEGTNPRANYATVRIKRPLTPGSYVGFMMTDKESGNPQDRYNRSGGLDAKFVLFRNLNLRGYFVKSWGPGVRSDNAAFGGRITYANNWFNIYAGHGVTEKNFNPEMGFVTLTDSQPTLVDINLTPRPHVMNIREFDVGVSVSHNPNTTGKLIDREWTPNIRVLFNNGAEIDSAPEDFIDQYLLQPLHVYKNIYIPPGGYSYASHQIAYTSAGDRRLTYTASFQAGDYFTGTLKSATLTAQYRPNSHLTAAVNNTLNVFQLPQQKFNIELAALQLSYAFNRFMNLTTFVQADTSQTQAASANIRLRYTFRPDSDLYVIYNAGTVFQGDVAGNPVQERDGKIAVKVTYSWSR